MSAHIESWELTRPFRISGSEMTTSDVLVVQLGDREHIGRGEGQGVSYLGETPRGMFEQIAEVADRLRKGAGRDDLPEILPAGGARNAVDCALWDLEAKRSGKTIWELTGIEPRPVTTVFTIGIEATAAAMAQKAAAAADYPILKIKLDGDAPLEKLAAIRAARPDAELVVDANQGWTFELLEQVLAECLSLNVSMVEQPLPRGRDALLRGFDSPITLAADESCQDTTELESCASCYDMINIKLDKTGGLTEALSLARAAKSRNLKLMVGNMVGTSLAMAPSFVVAQLCDFVDIDGPLLLKYDHPDGLVYSGGEVGIFDRAFWG